MLQIGRKEVRLGKGGFEVNQVGPGGEGPAFTTDHQDFDSQVVSYVVQGLGKLG